MPDRNERLYWVGWGIDLDEPDETFEQWTVPDLPAAREKLRELLVSFDPAGCEVCERHQREALVDLISWDGEGSLTVYVDAYDYGIRPEEAQ